MENWIDWDRCAWRECGTFGAAVVLLGRSIGIGLGAAASKQDREAIARCMIQFSGGQIDVGPHSVRWFHEETASGYDVLYKID
jgi:hypothetical protein